MLQICRSSEPLEPCLAYISRYYYYHHYYPFLFPLFVLRGNDKARHQFGKASKAGWSRKATTSPSWPFGDAAKLIESDLKLPPR